MSKRIALLTAGTGECHWYLMNALRGCGTDFTVVSTSRITVRQRLRPIYQYLRHGWSILLRSLILGQTSPLPVWPPSMVDVLVANDINAPDVHRKLLEFKPDILCISGTKIVKSHILETAKLCLNLHHGFVPYYRGVSSLNWVCIENNFEYFYVTVHAATAQLDRGAVYQSRADTPNLMEGLFHFQRRLMLNGGRLMVEVCDAPENYEPIHQPQGIASRNYRHAEKPDGFSEMARTAFDSDNMKRFQVNGQGAGKGPVYRYLRRRLRKKLVRPRLSNGFYLVNYHDICKDVPKPVETGRIPAIYTTIDNFQACLSG